MDDRRVNGSSAEGYADAVDAAVARHCGIGYRDLLAVNEGLDRDGHLLSRCREINMPATEFAEKFASAYGFMREDGTGTAAEHNRFRGALLEFSEASRWKITGDGPARIMTEKGELVMDVVQKDGRTGFGVKLAGQPDETAYVRLDIGDAVTGMFHRLRQDVDLTRPMENAPGMAPR